MKIPDEELSAIKMLEAVRRIREEPTRTRDKYKQGVPEYKPDTMIHRAGN